MEAYLKLTAKLMRVMGVNALINLSLQNFRNFKEKLGFVISATEIRKINEGSLNKARDNFYFCKKVKYYQLE